MKREAPLEAETGATLVEVLLTVVIVGVAFAVIVGGIGTSVLVSDIHRKQATAGATLRSFAEAVKTEPYVACATTASYPGAVITPPSGYTKAVTGVRFWNEASGTFVAACAADPGLQLVTVEVRSIDERAVETLEVVKRNP